MARGGGRDTGSHSLAPGGCAAGEPWAEYLPPTDADGSPSPGTCLFIVSYTVIVCWTLLQASDRAAQIVGDIMLCYVMLCYVILYYIIPIVCWTLLQACDRARRR